jgi:hypothetical protein
MKRLLLLPLALLGLACEPTINPPPTPPPVTYLFKEIFWSSSVDVNATPPRREPHSCGIAVSLGDGALRGYYEVTDPFWRANGWAFWTACVIPARDSGRALPTAKSNPACDNARTLLVLGFHLDTAPIFGVGSGHYSSFNATNFAVWCKTHVESTG